MRRLAFPLSAALRLAKRERRRCIPAAPFGVCLPVAPSIPGRRRLCIPAAASLLVWALPAGAQSAAAGAAPTGFAVPSDLIAAVAMIIVAVVALIWRLPAEPRDLSPAQPASPTRALPIAPASRRVLRSFGSLWFLISLLFTGTFIAAGFLSIYRNTVALAWPAVRGTVLESRVETRTVSGEDGTTTSYAPYVRYAYFVRGSRYENDQVYPTGCIGIGSSNAPDDATRHLQALVGRGPLLVRYDPAAPDDSALQVSPQSGFAPFILGLGFFLLFTVAIGGGMMTGAGQASCTGVCRKPGWVERSAAMGIALILVGFASFPMMTGSLPGGPGWWALSFAVIAVSQILVSRRQTVPRFSSERGAPDASGNEDQAAASFHGDRSALLMDAYPISIGRRLEAAGTQERLTITDTTPASTHVVLAIACLIGALFVINVMNFCSVSGLRMSSGAEGVRPRLLWSMSPAAIARAFGPSGLAAVAAGLCAVIGILAAGVRELVRARTGGPIFVFDRALDRLERSGRLLTPMSALRRVELKQITRTSGENGPACTVYRVVLHTRDGRRIRINADDLDQVDGQSLAQRIATFTGLPLHDTFRNPYGR